MYRVLVQGGAADEFFCLLLSAENRTYFRKLYRESEIVRACGCSVLSEGNRITQNKKVLNIISNRLPVGVKIEYNKSEAEPRNFDKLLLWETFPAEDNEQLEKRVFQAEKIMKKNSFLQVDIILYIGNIKTASTDLKSNIEPLKKSKNNCENKYKQCNVYAFTSEEDFIQNIIYLIVPRTIYEKKKITDQINSLLNQKEDDLQNIYYLYDFEMEFLSGQNGVLSSEQLYSISSWKNIAHRQNLMEAYFESFVESNVYSSIINEIVMYYRNFIKDICIWDVEKDCFNLEKKIKGGLLSEKKLYSKNSISAPKTEIEYKAQIYTNEILKFNKAVSDFFAENAKKILCSHISEKIKTYRGLLK